MNQILMTENKKKKKKKSQSGPLEIKGIVRFFSIVIMIFGIVFVGQGSYAFYREVQDKNPANLPNVTIGRLNDTVILYVEHTEEISKIIYSWNDGESTVLPEGDVTAQEEILLPNENSTLYVTIEDMKGKQVNYQKYFLLEGVDITKPTIEINVQDGNKKMTITAMDETEILYLSYQWEGEEPVIIDATTQGQTQIKKEIDLVPGTRKINIIAEDANGNIEQIQKEIVASTSEPQIKILQDKAKITLEVRDEDGVKDVKINLNGEEFAAKDINLKAAKLGPLTLREGDNTIAVEVTNVSGYTKKASTQIQYTH